MEICATSSHLSLHHFLLLFKLLLLLDPLSIDYVQGMFVRNVTCLHVHIVYLIVLSGVLDGPPGLWHRCLQPLDSYPQEVLVRLYVNPQILRIFNNL